MNLFIDTSSDYIILVFFKENKIITFFKQNTNKKHNELLIHVVNNFFKSHNVKAVDIKSIFCINGPGSFTGIRVGLTFIKAWHILYPEVSIYVADAFAIQDPHILYISANKTEVYDKSYNIHKKNNIDEKLIGYENFDLIEKAFISNMNNFHKIPTIEDLKPLYIKGHI